MSTRRQGKLLTEVGYELTSCTGCLAPLVRHIPEATERTQYNWLASCPACDQRLCIDCFPPGAAECVHCVQQRQARAV